MTHTFAPSSENKKHESRGHMEFILCAFGGNVSGINWFARICQERASAWLKPVLLKLIPQRFTAVNQALTCPYDVWIYYSKCCVGLGEPLILAPGDHLCFQSKDHLENGPGRLQCLWTQATVQTQETSADGPHSEDCLDEIIVSNVLLCFKSVW